MQNNWGDILEIILGHNEITAGIQSDMFDENGLIKSSGKQTIGLVDIRTAKFYTIAEIKALWREKRIDEIFND